MGTCFSDQCKETCEDIAKNAMDLNNDGVVDGKDVIVLCEKLKGCCTVS